MSNLEIGQIVGLAGSKIGDEAGRQAQYVRQVLERASTPPENFGEPYPPEVVTEYAALITHAGDVTVSEASRALGLLIDWARVDKKDRQDIDLTNPNQRLIVAKALKGIENLATGLTGEDSRMVTDPSQMGARQRELYYRRLSNELREKFGINARFDKEKLLRLVGDVVAISPQEIGNISALVQRERASFDGKVTDEVEFVLKAFEGGKEGGTYSSLMALSDISQISMKDYGLLVSKLKPNEVFFLANLPFVVEDTSGNQISITAAEVFEWLVTPEGMKIFRESPHESTKLGLNEFMDWLQVKYPNVTAGLQITSDFSIASEEAGKDWRKADVLDGGKRGLVGLEKPYLEMATNTWLHIFLLARGMANAFVGRQVFYREGNISLIGKDLQKAANSLPFYFENYAMWDEWSRNTFPRFGGLGERMMSDNPLLWLLPQPENDGRPLQPDFAYPFTPRAWNERRGGVEIDYGGLNENDRVRVQIALVDLFNGVEEGPGEGLIEAAVADLYRGANGYYYNDIGERITCPQLNQAQLIARAWECNKKIRKSVYDQASFRDGKLETIMQYRTYFPLPPDVIMTRLNNMDPETGRLLDKVDFTGLYVRLGGALPTQHDLIGVYGALEVTKLMRSGWMARPNWGTQPVNAPEKHAGYEEKMVEIYQEILGINVAGIQAKTDELSDRVGGSLVGGRRDMDAMAIKAFDRLISRAKGIQSDVTLRQEAIKGLFDHFTKAVQAAGFMSKTKGIWWITKYGEEVAKSMFGYLTSYQYLSSGRKYDVHGTSKHAKPVVYGDPAAKYSDLYRNIPREALAIIGCYVDNKEPVYPARAGRISPIAMTGKNGEVVPVVFNISTRYGHQQPIAFTNPEVSVRLVVDEMWSILEDSKLQTADKKTYFFNLNKDNTYKVA